MHTPSIDVRGARFGAAHRGARSDDLSARFASSLVQIEHAESTLYVATRFPTLGASRRLLTTRTSGRSAGSTCDVGGHDVGCVSVQGHPGPVVTHRGPRV